MQELGKKEDLFGKENLRSITIFGRPNRMPPLSPSEKVICGYNQGLGERMIVCDNLDEMQELYTAYEHGGALDIHWYIGEDPGVMVVLNGE